MKEYQITFRSVTYAQRGERLLNQQGIGCRLHRTPRQMQERGCGYSLRLRTADIYGAVALLQGAQLPLRRVYWMDKGGHWEEVFL